VTLGCSSKNDNNYGSFASLETNSIDRVIDLSLIILVTGARILGVYGSRMKTFFTSFYHQLEQLVPHSIIKALDLGSGRALLLKIQMYNSHLLIDLIPIISTKVYSIYIGLLDMKLHASISII
jgi:hypothetical protein